MAKRTDLKALRRMIAQAETILKTTDLPEGRAERARELLSASVKLADHLLTESPAAALGSKGGKVTSERMKAKDPDYYKRIAGMRKIKGATIGSLSHRPPSQAKRKTR
jgi:hypothetical protein